MSTLTLSNNQRLPAPQIPLAFRLATLADIPALDALQKKHHKALGFFPRAQLQGYVEMGGVLVAYEPRASATGEPWEGRPVADARGSLGYIISRDRYLKRDELGVIYQLCIRPDVQRGNIGAALLREVFARSAYGCKLYCCWCAQDLAANHFWEAMGFVPIAFRAGSRKRRVKAEGGRMKQNSDSSFIPPPSSVRVHIFWQRRVNAEDTTTPWWYPCQTSSGAIREDRLVLPVPPGVHWSEVRAIRNDECGVLSDESQKERRRALPAPKSSTQQSSLTAQHSPKPRTFGGWNFSPPPPPPLPVPEKPAKAKREPAAKVKADPKQVALVRELRDRWMERVNDADIVGCGKYEVSRMLPCGAGFQPAFLEEQAGKPAPQQLLLPAA